MVLFQGNFPEAEGTLAGSENKDALLSNMTIKANPGTSNEENNSCPSNYKRQPRIVRYCSWQL